jgi:serine phosphatase RsbU (regulator of sigma subunit)
VTVDALEKEPNPGLGRRPAHRRAVGRSAPRAVRPIRMSVIVGSIGLVITLLLTVTAWTLNRHNERRLLEVQTRQAGAVLASTILSISNPLATALQIEEATGGDVAQFGRFISTYVGAGRLFVSASLWESDGSSVEPVVSVGVEPALATSSSQAHAFVTRALHSTTFVVTSIRASGLQRIGYADADPEAPAFAVYAERAIPANRQVSVESDSAFSDLDYATYLGPTTGASDLATTDVPVGRLPLSGETSRESIPFGDTTLTLVASARGQLGGPLGPDLPWIFLSGGVLLSVATALGVRVLVTRRREAEDNAHTIAGLYEQVDGLYREQRTIAEALQRTLLPRRHPAVRDLEIASLYFAGADGVEIGGDWYSLIGVGNDHFAFAVGDVSGKGISAASIMARLRFTIRAYLIEGHRPDVVLEMCSRQLDLDSDGHFATVLVGIGDLTSRKITIANAGHLNPVIASPSDARYVSTTVGVPLGIASSGYASNTVVLPPGSTFLAFTDGLIERRGENIEIGLQRLLRAAARPVSDLDEFLTQVVDELAHIGSQDDIAVLAFRWQDSAAL